MSEKTIESAALFRDSGVYQLLVELREPRRIKVGRLGTFDFPAGCYVYTGSAKRALRARLRRHLRRRKQRRWHIDYLLVAPGARVREIAVQSWTPRAECRLNQQTAARNGAQIPVPGFGASDCRAGCGAHLLHFSGAVILAAETPLDLEHLLKAISVSPQ